jgi:hypothetical protein
MTVLTLVQTLVQTGVHDGGSVRRRRRVIGWVTELGASTHRRRRANEVGRFRLPEGGSSVDYGSVIPAVGEPHFEQQHDHEDERRQGDAPA